MLIAGLWLSVILESVELAILTLAITMIMLYLRQNWLQDRVLRRDRTQYEGKKS